MPPRTFKGTCALCGASIDKRRSPDHYRACAPAHDGQSGREANLLELRIGAVGASEYWLDVETDAGAALSKLDAFLRKIWLECCGHLSLFSVPPFTYSSSPGGLAGPFGRANTERSMRSAIGDVFASDGHKGTYDYDFGSTTRLSIGRVGSRIGRMDKPAVRLLGRNHPLRWTCGVCDQPATLVCCSHESDSTPFVCAAHKKAHRCPDKAFLPVVNSPRMGVCAYEG